MLICSATRLSARVLGHQGAQDQLRMGVESDREIAATDSQPNDQGAMGLHLESPPAVFASEWPAGLQDRCASGKANLATMGVSGESYGKALLFE